ncbi:MAG: MoaD/ThiS family protein [Myxococcota bacterium]|nr:MoaD/ThiS family protein [Myxococcota bacterium]
MRIRVHATLRPIVGGRDVDVPLEPGATVRDLVLRMVECWPDLEDLLLRDGDLSRHVHVFVDGRSSRFLPDGADTVLKEGQEVDVAPAVAGG